MEYVTKSVQVYNNLAKVHGVQHIESDPGDSQVLKETISKLMTTSTKKSMYATLQALVFPVALMGFTLSRIEIGLIFKIVTIILVISHVMVITHQNFVSDKVDVI